jgi:carboxypeptidase Q
MRRIAFLVAALALPGAAHTQAFSTNDPVLRRMWSIGMDSSQTWPLAQSLLDSVGPRLTGTPGQKAGNDFLLAKYRAWGISARAEPYGTWRGWRRGVTHVDLIAPRVRTLDAIMLAWSPGTPRGAAVDAAPVIVPDLPDAAAFTAWLPQARGKAVLISMAQPTCRPDDNWREFADSASFARMREPAAA